MNLNDPEMQKQLGRWEPRNATFASSGGRFYVSYNSGPWQEIAQGCAWAFEPLDGWPELQPARGWADYDTAFLKDLGISPLET